MLLSGALICKMRGWDGCAVGTLPYPRPCGQQPLPLRPVVWTMKSKPSVPRTWRRRSTSGEKGAASAGCGLPAGRGRETAPTKSEEEISNNSWKCVRRGRTFQPQELREGTLEGWRLTGGFLGQVVQWPWLRPHCFSIYAIYASVPASSISLPLGLPHQTLFCFGKKQSSDSF